MSRLLSARPLIVLAASVLGILMMTATAKAQTTWYVDDDAPGDPGPGDPSISDPLEDGSPAHPFDAIQEGINAGVNGDTVLVLDGTYTGDGNRDLDLGGKLITVRSANGPASCIVDCEGDPNDPYDPHRAFSFYSGETEASVVDGFTITHGNANPGGAIRCDLASSPTIINCTISVNRASEDGGAIVCWNNSSPTITDCTITDNAAGWGGGLQLWQSNATISNCTISGNDADNDGGGVHCWESSPTIANCTITGNMAHWWDGGGIFCGEYSLATITECTIAENGVTSEISWGGGIYCLFDSDATISDCTITENFAAHLGGGVAAHQSGPTIANCTIAGNTAVDRGGGVCDLDAWATIANCTITGNTANSGGGVCSSQQNSHPTIIDCTIAGNSAIQHGGGIYCSGDSYPTIVNCAITSNTANDSGGGVCSNHSTPTITNCTIAGNSAPNGRALACDSGGYPSTVVMGNCVLWDGGDEVWSNDDSTIIITYSDIQGGWPGDGNIDEDPLFVDPGNDDYHLSTGSPCINTGSNYVPDLPDVDIGGNPRIQYCRVDMGAYESPYPPPTFEDCNENGEDDDCDIYEGTSADYDRNSVPDECEDCNANGIPDACDLDCNTGNCASHPLGCGGSEDCQPDDVPDECQLEGNDCNANGVPDECDIAQGTSDDCNANGIPDECDIADGTSDDYDLNGVPDECEDCNANGVPDACDIDCDTGNCASHPLGCGGSDDYDLNGVPDECDPDCNQNGIPDACDLDCATGNCASHPLGCGGSADCNENGVPDECDIADGTSEDCQPNGVPDECDIADGTSADCQHNGVPDECDIADGTSEDANANGVPDECEAACVADELAKLLASDGAAGDVFGFSVAISGEVAAIGAPGDDDNGSNSGSAYVFRFDGSTWAQEAKLLPSDGAAGDYFGCVAISGDAIVVGAWYDDDNGSNSGSAYVFRYDGSSWVEEAKLLPSDGAAGDWFGVGVALSGETAVIGAVGDGPGSAYVFRYDGSSWVQESKLVGSGLPYNANFGEFVSISGDTAVIGAWCTHDNGANSGSAYVFRYDGTNWIEEAKLLASDGAADDNFGNGVAVSGDCIVVGGRGNDDNGTGSGSAYIFRYDGANWVEEAKLLPSDGAAGDSFGNAVALSGNIALIEAFRNDDNGTDSGSAYVFRYDGSHWLEQAKLLASDGAPGDWLGYLKGVAISADIAVVGAFSNDDNGSDSGSAYAFHGLSDCNTNGALDICDINNGTSDDINGNGIPDECEGPCQANELAKLLAPDGAAGDDFGMRVAVSGDIAVIGAHLDDDNGTDSGSAYVFRFDGSTWQEEAKLLPSDGAPGDRFGKVAVSGDIAVIGATGDDDNGTDSGSAYVFRYDGSTWIEEAKLLASDGAAGDTFGFSVAISGNAILIGAPVAYTSGLGSAYVFRHDGSSWVQEARLLASDGALEDKFGSSVALSGDAALIGARYDDDNGGNSGSAYVFRYDGSNWIEEVKLLAPDGAAGDGFGYSVAVAGNLAVIGAQNDNEFGQSSGSAYIFRYGGSSWVEEAKLVPSDGAAMDQFGGSVAVAADIAVIGSGWDDDSGDASGSVYVFRYDGSHWLEQAKLLASDGAPVDWLGLSVAISGDTAVIGARGDDDHGAGSGSAYVFRGLSDCNDNGALDICDIANGASQDDNGNGVPDECEGPECPGDLDGDLDVDLADLAQLLAHYGMTEGATYSDGDLDGDSDVDLSDLAALLAVYGTTCE